ncbi:methyltransferase [Gordonia sp. (in: high G+C Gram-positive bacteria)]|uniref:DUF7782 domain-containing protein n=1 Tax=Gordonia sp. (in: high G+C Gram-positive bacteria) TaxID=84139 RepID=UPI00168F0A8B|nr:methyltransferase [Gordonia sp. (in: high G+C Gram-positive bacteria)]NLG45418.1 methyltransferase [Gordonia sp. (in: high G+C Gram-positive bacteria)]
MIRYPLDAPEIVDALGEGLRSAGYSSEGIDGLLGEETSQALVGGVWWPALRKTRRAPAEQASLATLIRLFLLGSTEPDDAVAAALPGIGVDALLDQQVIEKADGGVRAILDIRPHGSDAADYLVVADQDASMRPGAVRHDHVLGIGGASMSLAQAVIRTPFGRALDVGTGCGVQALHMSSHCDEIVATDTNGRALALAAATARLNGLDWDLREGSLFEPVGEETFDLIVSNPPFVVGTGAQDYIYRDSGMVGDGISRALIEQIGDHLNPGGVAQILANWVVRDVDAWDQRVREWVESTGLDAWVVQRELADPISYVSLWVSDAGESVTDAAERGARWLDWFEQEGIVAIGMGSITFRKPTQSREADVVIEEITGAGQEVTGFEAQAFWARRDFLRENSDADLLASRLSTSPVFLETQSLPGEEGWQQVSASVTRPGGPGAVLAVDEVLTALFAGCRGEVPLAALISLIADFHGVDPDALAQAAMPSVREAIGRGILYRAD